jgi:hypothetical protein
MCTNGIDARARVCVDFFERASRRGRAHTGFHLRIEVDAMSTDVSNVTLESRLLEIVPHASFRPTRRSTGREDISRYFVNHRVTKHPKRNTQTRTLSRRAARSRGALGDGRCGRRLRRRSTTRGGGGDGPRRELQSAVNAWAECADMERCE